MSAPHNDANFGIGTLCMISICVKNLNKRYRARDGDVPALADVDIEVKEGEFVTIVGPSGCGKSTLLGGMKQRVAIARTLAYDPKILLLDEPFGALDALTREGMQDELLRLWQATRKTVVMVTHDVNEAVYLSGRVLVMSQRPGRIVQEFPVTIDRTGEREVTVLNDDFNHLRNEVWLAVRRQAGANAGASEAARDA